MPTLDEIRAARLARQKSRDERFGAIGDTLRGFFGVGQDTVNIADVGVGDQLAPTPDTAAALGVPPAIAAAPSVPVAQPVTAQPSQTDAAGALAQPVQQQIPPVIQAQPDFVANILAAPSGPVPGETTDIVQSLNGVQEPGIEGAAPTRPVGADARFPGPLAGEIPDVAAEGAPGVLAKFGEFAQTVSGELATNPVLRDLLGQVAQALTAKDPTGLPFQLAGGIRESAQAAQVEMVRQNMLDVLAGRGPDERVDINQLTISPELMKQGQVSALNEFSAAIAGQTALAGIQTPEERAAELQLTQTQVQATQQLANQRYLENIETLTGAGVVQEFNSTHLSLLRFINQKATDNAALVAGTTGSARGPGGEITYLFKDPEKARRIIEEQTRTQIAALVDAEELPESAMLLTTGVDDPSKITTAPNISGLDTSIQPPSSVANDKRLGPNPKFMGSKKEDGGKTLWYFDTNGDGKIDQAVRK